VRVGFLFSNKRNLEQNVPVERPERNESFETPEMLLRWWKTLLTKENETNTIVA